MNHSSLYVSDKAPFYNPLVKTSMKRSNNEPNRFNLRRTLKNVNQLMTATQKIPPQFQAPYPEGGLRGLIFKILRTHGAAWRGEIELPADRAAAIEAAMYTEDILERARERFTAGSTRYPPHSIKACLGITMLESGDVGRIQLSPGEDGQRRSARPRCKWYWARA
jgi:hypothetical protein